MLVAADGRVASGAAPGPDAIHRLVAAAAPPAPRLQVIPPAAAAAQAESGLPVGTQAPDLAFPRLDGGGDLTLGDAPPEGRMLVFWNTGCGFCAQMVDRLRALERERPAEASEIVLVSAGGAEANRDQELASVIVLDDDFTAGPMFGTGGTPTAVLIDGDGRIASSVVAGADAVLDLAARAVNA
jgi:hypothetical protein